MPGRKGAAGIFWRHGKICVSVCALAQGEAVRPKTCGRYCTAPGGKGKEGLEGLDTQADMRERPDAMPNVKAARYKRPSLLIQNEIRESFNQVVVGSIPTGLTIKSKT